MIKGYKLKKLFLILYLFLFSNINGQHLNNSDDFNMKLKKCNDLIGEFTKRKLKGKDTSDLDIKWKKNNCDYVLKKYEDILKKKWLKASKKKEERWNRFYIFVEELKRKAIPINDKVNIYPIKLENYKYLIFDLPIDPNKYEILKIDSNLKLHFVYRFPCNDRYIIYFLVPNGKNSINLKVFFVDKYWLEDTFKLIRNLSKDLKFKDTKVFKIEKNIYVDKFKPVNAKILKSKNFYTIELPIPVDYAYLEYTFIGLKKRFPKSTCLSPKIKVKELPDDICIRLNMLTKEGGIGYKDFCIKGTQY